MAAQNNSKLAAWKKARRHKVTLASGTEVEIELPNLPAMIKGGEIPNSLLDVALDQQSSNDRVSADQIKEQFAFYKFLVAKTVVEPDITEDDVEELPYEDVEMVVEFATRQRDLDALGHHISGLDKVSDFRKFRGLDRSDALDGVIA